MDTACAVVVVCTVALYIQLIKGRQSNDITAINYEKLALERQFKCLFLFISEYIVDYFQKISKDFISVSA